MNKFYMMIALISSVPVIHAMSGPLALMSSMSFKTQMKLHDDIQKNTQREGVSLLSKDERACLDKPICCNNHCATKAFWAGIGAGRVACMGGALTVGLSASLNGPAAILVPLGMIFAGGTATTLGVFGAIYSRREEKKDKIVHDEDVDLDADGNV